MRAIILGLLLLAGLAVPAAAAPVASAVDLDVRFDPSAHRIEGRATLSVTGAGDLTFRLNRALTVRSVTILGPAGEAAAEPACAPEELFWQTVTVVLPEGATGIRVEYAGEIHDVVRKAEDLAFVVGDKTRGVISDEGIFLVAGSGWYPAVEELVAFRSIRVTVPEPLVAVTQGAKLSREIADGVEVTTWGSDVPVDGLALQAGKYVVTTRMKGSVAISTYLFEADQAHSALILDEVERYLDFYRPILGEYPWPKFDIVENFFATGYGMPTYTLLGDTVVRQMVMMAPRYGGHIPPGFVDHELVHCWWGNFVYPDWRQGNWCEGLTTYCSNYLMKEAESEAEAAAHRQKICTTFSIQVNEANDYPVRAFAGKTEDFENDIGYGKCAMLFHMLRRQVGSDLFFATLRRIVKEFGGKYATWADFERVFSEASGTDLGWFFAQWLDRTGGPVLSAGDFSVTRLPGGHYEVKGEIRQDGDPWRLEVPVTVEHAGGLSYRPVPMDGPSATFTIVTPRPPLRVRVDAEWNVFRRLPLDQIPPCLNLTLSRPEKVLVVPEGDTPYRALAEAAQGRKGGEIVVADGTLPATDCVLFGGPEENRASAAVLAAAGVAVNGASITVKGQKYEADDLWALVSTPHPQAEGRFVTVFLATSPAAFARARIFFYYGWDGYLVYSGRAPLARGNLGDIAARTVRSFDPGEVREDRVGEVVAALVDPDLAGRLAGSPGDRLARGLLAARLREAGADPVAEEPFSFTVRDFDDPDSWTVAAGTLEGGDRKWATSWPGAVVPALFSKAAPDGVEIRRITADPKAADGQTLLLLPLPENAEALSILLASVANTPAAAIGIPMAALDSKDPALAGLAAYPSRPAKPGPEDPWLAASGRQSRAMAPPVDLPCPVVFVDARILAGTGTEPADARLRVRFVDREIRSANVVADLPAPNARPDAAPLLLTAHFDSLGAGFAGADDNASGVAAVLEAARCLVSRGDLLGRPVRVVLFGAEEWGLRGSAAFAAAHPAPAAVVNLDTVGAGDAAEVFLIGRSLFPELSARAAACLGEEGFAVGKDIDRFALAYGSDHWPFAARGVPALDLFSGQYRRMNSTDDEIGLVDLGKTARIGRAAARLVLDLSAGGLKAPPAPPPVAPPVTTFDGESAHLSDLRMLTRGGENAEAYFCLPACDRLTFQRKAEGMPADQIFTMAVDGTGMKMVSNGKGATTCAYMIPGTRRVVYATTMYHGDDPPAPPDRSKGYVWKLHPEFDIVVSDEDGGNLVRLTDAWGYDAEPTLSPDGAWIVFCSTRSGDPEIYRMRTDGSEMTRLTHADGYDGGPFFSWDGKSIIYRANRPVTDEEKEKYRVLREEWLVSPVNLEIWIMDADGSNQRQITRNGAANFAPFLHPDGKRVVFCSNLATLGKRGMPNFDIWMVNVDGTGLERITSCPEFDGFPMFSKDGTKIVFCSNRDNGGTHDTNVFLADWKD